MQYENSFNIRKLFSGYLEQLKAESAYFSDSVKHSGEKGRLNETHIAHLLRRYLPHKFGIGTGFIVSTNSEIRISPQCDIIIYDSVNNAPIYESDAFSIYPIEMVYAVIEVKTNISKKIRNPLKNETGSWSELDDSLSKCAKIRQMAEEFPSEEKFNALKLSNPLDYGFIENDHANRKVIAHKGYLRSGIINGKREWTLRYDKLPPRFFIFSYNGWKKLSAFEENFRKVSARHEWAHVHGICILNEDGGFYVNHIAYQRGNKKIGKIIPKDGFMTFLLSLPLTLDTMLPPPSDRLGNGFDIVNLGRYDIEF